MLFRTITYVRDEEMYLQRGVTNDPRGGFGAPTTTSRRIDDDRSPTSRTGRITYLRRPHSPVSLSPNVRNSTGRGRPPTRAGSGRAQKADAADSPRRTKAFGVHTEYACAFFPVVCVSSPLDSRYTASAPRHVCSQVANCFHEKRAKDYVTSRDIRYQDSRLATRTPSLDFEAHFYSFPLRRTRSRKHRDYLFYDPNTALSTRGRIHWKKSLVTVYTFGYNRTQFSVQHHECGIHRVSLVIFRTRIHSRPIGCATDM